MNDNQPLVSIIIPCRNEEKFIGRCLDSLVSQDYPEEKRETIIVDGISEDKTREIVKNYTAWHSNVKLLDNPKKITPIALNAGIRNSKGQVIALMNAHTAYQKDYISKCVKYLEDYEADNVGGITKILPSRNALLGKAIALVLSNSFGVGNAYYKAAYPEQPREVDTVFGGCYKKEVFKKIGLFNEKLIRSQDLEFNLRLKKAGGKIFLVPEIISYYYARSNLKDFFLHNFEDGIWAILPLKFVKIPFKLRHYIPLIFVSSLLGSLVSSPFFFSGKILFILIFGSYFVLNLFFSLKISLEKGLKYLFIMPIVFASRHIGYGLGSIFGLVKLLLPMKK